MKSYDTAEVPEPTPVPAVTLPYAVLVPHWNQALVLAPFGSAVPFRRAAVWPILLAELVTTVGGGVSHAAVVKLRSVA